MYDRNEERMLKEPRSQVKLSDFDVFRCPSRSMLWLTGMQGGKLRCEGIFAEEGQPISRQLCQHSIRFEHNIGEDKE